MAAFTAGTVATPVPRNPRDKIIIQNLGAVTVYLDTVSTVTTSSGIAIEPNAVMVLDGGFQGQYFLISSASVDIRYMVVG